MGFKPWKVWYHLDIEKTKGESNCKQAMALEKIGFFKCMRQSKETWKETGNLSVHQRVKGAIRMLQRREMISLYLFPIQKLSVKCLFCACSLHVINLGILSKN